jgi:hypothetical protein
VPSLVSDPRERVAQSLGPLQGDEARYWATLADWEDWSAWTPPSRPEALGGRADRPSWRSRVRAMGDALDEDARCDA